MEGRLGDFIGDVVTAIVEHPIVQLAGLGAFVTVATLWLATAYWVVADLRRRHTNPGLAYLAAAGVMLASPVFFPLALGVYLILRPSHTLAQARQQRLAEIAIDLEEQAERCPECGQLTEEEWIACPACRTRLGHLCVGCGRTMGLGWNACAWCATEVPDAGPIAETELPNRGLVPAGPEPGPGPAGAPAPATPVTAVPAMFGASTPTTVTAAVGPAVAGSSAAPSDALWPAVAPEPARAAQVGESAMPPVEHIAAAGAVGAPAAGILGRRFAITRRR